MKLSSPMQHKLSDVFYWCIYKRFLKRAHGWGQAGSVDRSSETVTTGHVLMDTQNALWLLFL